MTPAQRQYDIDLVASMHKMAQWIEPRSRKVSDTLRFAAITHLRACRHVCQPMPTAQLDKHGNKIQPASTPEVKTG